MSEFGCCADQHAYGICTCPRHERSALHPLGDVKPRPAAEPGDGDAATSKDHDRKGR